MKYQLIRYSLLICTLFGIIALLTIIKVKDVIGSDVFFAGIAGVLTLFISIINHYRDNDKFFKELFTEFNRRYDRMNNFLNQVTDKKLEGKEKQNIIDYLNLCAEEYMWVKKGRIPHKVWKSWKNGIETFLKVPSIKEVFDEERKLWKSSYYGFFDEINA
jgi:intergrase/recombinase